MVKRIIAIILSIMVLSGTLTALSGCGVEKSDKITVLCTVFPIYDWVRSVVGDSEKVEVKLLVSGSADLHSYQPTVNDVIAVRGADLTVRVGGMDDSFVGELLKNGGCGQDLRLMEIDGIVKREISQGSHEEEHDHHHEHDHEHTVDEHIWLSLKNAAVSVNAVCEALSRLSPADSEQFRKNADAYIERLSALDGKYLDAVSKAPSDKLIFADRFPFVYMTEDYGIEYEAAFKGCSTEADASFDTVIRLADRLDGWALSYVCVTESSDRELAECVIRASESKKADIIAFDSMQSVSESDIASGATYLGIAESNLETLKIALSTE